MMIAGARERIVTKNKIIRERLVSFGFLASFTLKLKLGIGILVFVLCAYTSAPTPSKRIVKKLIRINLSNGLKANIDLTLLVRILVTEFLNSFRVIFFARIILLCLIVCQEKGSEDLFPLPPERFALSFFNFSNLSSCRNLISSMISSSSRFSGVA